MELAMMTDLAYQETGTCHLDIVLEGKVPHRPGHCHHMLRKSWELRRSTSSSAMVRYNVVSGR
jgi:hypothetical protein